MSLELIALVLFILWLLGYFTIGHGAVHVLLVIVAVLVIIRLLRGHTIL